jgi:hypothetical protein
VAFKEPLECEKEAHTAAMQLDGLFGIARAAWIKAAVFPEQGTDAELIEGDQPL